MQLELDLPGGSMPLPLVIEHFGTDPAAIISDLCSTSEGCESSEVTEGWEACKPVEPVSRREAHDWRVILTRGVDQKAVRVRAASPLLARMRARWMAVDSSPAGVWTVVSLERLQ